MKWFGLWSNHFLFLEKYPLHPHKSVGYPLFVIYFRKIKYISIEVKEIFYFDL